MLNLYYKGWVHHKNKNGLDLVRNSNLANIYVLNCGKDGIIFSFDNFDINIIENNEKVIIGPHIEFFKMIELCKNYKGSKKVYVNTLSEWQRKLFLKYSPNPYIEYVNLPFPVDIYKFVPSDIRTNNTIMIYYKDVNEIYLKTILTYISQHEILKNFSIKIFIYGQYNEDEYLDFVKNCTFGIWIGRHESQGFALQEALSSGCPPFVYDILSMKDEYSIFEKKFTYLNIDMDLEATTAPYFDERCGMICKISETEIDKKLDMFYCNVKNNKYDPREYILENLTVNNFVNNVKNIFN
jgi:hypothetical protein